MADPLGKDRARRLARLSDAKERAAEGLMLLDSAKLVTEAMAGGLVVELFRRPGEHGAVVAEALARGIGVTPADEPELRKLVDVGQSAGLAAIARIPTPADPDRILTATPAFGFYLDGVADPGNVGAIARSAAAFGAGLLLLSPGCADPWGPKALRASAGALLRLPVARGRLGGLGPAARQGLTLYRAEARGGRDPVAVRPSARSMIWLGSEAHGPRDAAPGFATIDVTIRTQGAVESLNVAAAGALLAFLLGPGRGDVPT